MKTIGIFSALFVVFSAMGQPLNPSDISRVRDTYSFSWAYDLSVEVNGQKLEMTYRIEPDSSYYARSMKFFPAAIEVTDVARKLQFNAVGKSAKIQAYVEKPQKSVKSNYRYTKLPNKTIWGYNCIGLRAENDNEEAIFYFTNEAPAAYPELYKQLNVHHLVISLADYGFSNTSLLMLSDVRLKKKEGRATINCTRLEKQPVVVKKSEYTWSVK